MVSLRPLASLAVALTLSGCALRTSGPPAATPDLGGVLRVSTRFGLGHACPVAPDLALTAAHVIDPRPFDSSSPLVASVWSDGDGHSGYLRPVGMETIQPGRDLAQVKPWRGEADFPRYYALALEAPKAGSRAHILSYDFGSVSRAMGDRPVHTTIVRIVARQLVLALNTGNGSSGGCVLNDAGEVIGIIEGYYETEDGHEAGTAVGVWGWTPMVIPAPEPQEAQR